MAIQRIVSGLDRMTSPLKENSSTSVISRAMIVIGVRTWRNLSLNHASPFARDDPPSREVPRDQRQRDVDPDRQQQRLPRHRQAAHAEQKAAQDAVEHQHGQRVDGHHHQRVAVVAPGQVAPDQDHGRAGGDAEQDAAGQVAAPERHLEHLDAFDCDHAAGAVLRADRKVQAEGHLHQVRRLRADEPQEQRAEEEQRDGVHRERLDRPVDEQRQRDRLDASCRP